MVKAWCGETLVQEWTGKRLMSNSYQVFKPLHGNINNVFTSLYMHIYIPD